MQRDDRSMRKLTPSDFPNSAHRGPTSPQAVFDRDCSVFLQPESTNASAPNDAGSMASNYPLQNRHNINQDIHDQAHASSRISEDANRAEDGDTSDESAADDAGGQRKRRRTSRPISISCELCKQRKVKCDRGQPSCGWCLRNGQTCEYKERRKPGLRKSAHSQQKRQMF